MTIEMTHPVPPEQQEVHKAKHFPPTLFKRWPRWNPLPSKPQEIIPQDEREKHSAFASDFDTLQSKLIPAFRDLDNEALNCQNQSRSMYLILIVSSMLATMLIVIQIALLAVTVLDFIGTLIALALTIATSVLQAFKYQERYFNARLGAERLRSEYFLFLGHLGLYANNDRVQQLENQIIEIRKGAAGHGNT